MYFCPVEIVDANLTPIRELKVAKMVADEVINANPDKIDPSFDPDKFYACIKGGAPIGRCTVRVQTQNPDTSYNDGPVEMDMEINGNDIITKSLLLVSDEIDDNCPVDDGKNGTTANNARNDRTFKAQLGGAFQVTSLSTGTAADAIQFPEYSINY